MKWNGNKKIMLGVAQTRIIHCFLQPFSDRMPQMHLAIVFELQNNKANDASAAIGRDGSVECQGAICAVCAAKLLLDRSGKRFRAFRTKRSHDALRFIETILTDVIAAPNGVVANRTKRRVKERDDRVPGFKSALDLHNATSQSLAPR